MDNIYNTQDFDFYLELSKPNIYESLILDRTLTLALAILYQREQDESHNLEVSSTVTFSENDIRDCLRQVVPTEQREQHQRYNQFIRDLQTHFLWRDEENGNYQLKEYARNFCKLLYTRLEEKFEPTRAKRIFNRLAGSLESLRSKVEDDPETFKHWVDDEFEPSRYDISSQVEILYNKVDEVVQHLRDKVRPEADDLLSVLQHTEENLNILAKNADELDHIFHTSTIIQSRLDELQHKPYAELFADRISRVSTFLFDTGDKLHLVRRRIRKIRPHIQRLFNVRQREFDIKTSRFLVYLLENSQVAYQNGVKQIVFPKAIKEKPLFREKLNFTRITKQEFIPSKPIQAERSQISVEDRQKQELHYQQNSKRNEQLHNWLENIHLTLEIDGMVTLSNIFYQILDSQIDGTAMAIEVTQRAIRRYIMMPEYCIKVGNFIWKPNYPHHSICEITIQRTPLILS